MKKNRSIPKQQILAELGQSGNDKGYLMQGDIDKIIGS
jgi:hypothetical protein